MFIKINKKHFINKSHNLLVIQNVDNLNDIVPLYCKTVEYISLNIENLNFEASL